MNIKHRFEKLKNGDLKGVTIYPARKIEITVDNINMDIGEQPEYEIVNIIKKKQVPVLHKFLAEQYCLQSDKLKPTLDYLEQHKNIDAEGKVVSLLKDIKNDKKFKQYPKLDKYAEMVVQKDTAQRTEKTGRDALNKIKEQIDFIEKNYKI